jgi:hypothetical protein
MSYRMIAGSGLPSRDGCPGKVPEREGSKANAKERR